MKEEKKSKRKDYQRWYYQTYTKKRRDNGTVKVTKYQRKTEEEKAENRKRGAEKRAKTMEERYGKDGVKEIRSANGHKLARFLEEHPEMRYRPTSSKAKEMAELSAAAKRAKKRKRRNND